MPHSHSPVQVLPQLKRLDRHFGGPWSKTDINDRARDWAKHLAAAPMPSIEAAVDHLIEHHEGHYPKLAYVRRLALEHVLRTGQRDTAGPSEQCPSCGEAPGWHRLARPRLPEKPPIGWVDDDWMNLTVTRLVTRHRIGRPCQRFNEALHFADGEPDQEEQSDWSPREGA